MLIDRVIEQGRLAFAVAMLALGAENLACALLGLSESNVFAGRTVLSVIPWVPAHAWLGYLTGLVLVASALSIITSVKPRLMSIVLGSVFLFWMLLRVNTIFVARTGCFEMLALSGSAFHLAGILAAEDSFVEAWNPAVDGLIRSGRFLFAASSIVFGIDHFLFLRFVAALIPAWIPFHMFWAAFTGTGFIAAGLSIATGWLARWAGFLLGTMFLLWFLLLHMPRVLGLAGIVGAPHNPNEWSSAFIALAMCGGSWICARRQPKHRSASAVQG
jgi:uncharacterized membrane protein YphA (DoxX/SURF4 family)